ncbi:MAG: ribulokinase [Oscillospiraceae bacterium]|nr:ribulokinase [Oscillospiraceae bacterium]
MDLYGNSSEKYTIGIDYGSLSARAVLMRVSDGVAVASCVYEYPNAVLSDKLPSGRQLPPDWALQVPSDYREALGATIPEILKLSGVSPEQVIGLGLDVTSTTMLPTTAEGLPLCELPQYASEPHAYIKMWKHHGAARQAERMQRLAESGNVPWLSRFGGYISAEHYLPKAAQIADEAPELFEDCGRLIEVGDWLVWQLTGKESRGYCAAAFKTYYSLEKGDVDAAFLEKVSPRLFKLHEKLPSNVVMAGDAVGGLSAEGARLTGLLEGTPVSAAAVDAHVTAIGSKTTEAGAVLLIIGTSTCIIMQGSEYREVRGLNGVVPNGITSGMNAYEGGQAAVGDLFAWFCKNMVPQAYFDEAAERDMDIQQYLSRKASEKRPGESGLVALDWINGVRSVLMDFELSSLICGITLETRPEDIYRAFIEATAFGAWKTVKAIIESGVKVERIYASGGIPLKNELLMQIYADVFGMDIHVIEEPYSASLGSAILGLAASENGGGFENVAALCEGYRREAKLIYRPVEKNTEVYRQLFEIYDELYEQYGKYNDTMKKLRSLKGTGK